MINIDYIKHKIGYFLSRNSNSAGKKLLNDGFQIFLQSSSCGKSYTENYSSSLVNFGPCAPCSGSVCPPSLTNSLHHYRNYIFPLHLEAWNFPWSGTFAQSLSHDHQGHLPSLGDSPTNPRIVTNHPKDSHPNKEEYYRLEV